MALLVVTSPRFHDHQTPPGHPESAARATVMATVATALGLTLLWPTAGNLFRFGPLHGDDLAIAFGAGIFMLALLELLKPLWLRPMRSADAD